MSTIRLLAVATLLSSTSAFAQSSTGLITGTVTDASGAVVQNVTVTITQLQTNRRAVVRTGADGRFLSPALAIGDYKLESQAAGFKLASRSGITLEVNQTADIRVTLEVGTAAERIEVVAEAPLLESNTSELGKVVDNRRILELPLNTRNVFSLINLTPGAVGSSGIRYDSQAWSVYGARVNMNEIVVDGVSTVVPRPSGTSAASVYPPVDAIQEFKVIGLNPPAEFGRTSGTVLNVVYKSGSNQLHGSAFEFIRNSALDANDFFANSRGQDLASFKRNQFGGVISGPIRKNKTFFMGSYEGLREIKAVSTALTVPTELERHGDFSQTRAANGQLIQIYNPFTTRVEGTGFVRTPFPGNVIPLELLDSVGKNVVKYYPLPNTPGAPFTNQGNYASSGGNSTKINSYDFRVDHNFTDTQRFFARYSQRATDEDPAELFPAALAAASGREITGDRPKNFVAEYVNILSPNTVLTVRLGVNRTIFNLANQSLGFLPSSLGLPKSIDTSADVQVFPEISASGGYPTLGGVHADHRHSTLNSFPLVTSLSRTIGHHQLKFGFDGRLIRANLRETRTPDGAFPFTPAPTQGPNPLRASSTAGNSIASLLLGAGSGSELLYRGFKVQASQSYYMAWYAQDDWKITPSLTLNLGVRYDFDTPKTERYNRLTYFDPEVASPLATKVSAFPDLRGGLIHVGADGYPRNNFAFTADQVAPRLGFAWQPGRNTVLRGGYGHVYAASFVSATVADVPYGYGSETPWITSLDGVTPLNLLSNPFPNGLRQPEGTSRGLLAAVGQGFRAKKFNDPTTWSQQYNLTIQQALPGGVLIETGYVGVRSRGLEYTYYANELDPKYLALGPKLNELVPNPFYGVSNDGIFASPTVSRAQLLRPFPQFTDLTDAQDIPGDSWYSALQTTVKKRMGYGLQFEGSYVWSKSIDRGEGNSQSHHRLELEKAVSSRDVPHRFVVSYLYELPFGRGRYLGRDVPRLLNAVIGGWQFNGITTIQSGTGLSISANNSSGLLGTATYANNNGKSGVLSGRAQDRLNRWFDTSVFSQPEPFTFGNLAPRLSDIRSHYLNNSDLSLFKEFRPATETLRVQFRAEALNAFNRVQFGAPNTSVTSSAFGRVTTQANAPRQVQFGLKLLW